ncbi:hypothetical protein CALVIDRAFT_542043 [Calocera viscosa TUFC12733]|uniref:Putative ER transporter 6TM N-terminal domain-containing protein n=1 Tax=Calocera viscosa (strain TUFC12733) TaxID=1330018 RepID=A0A167H3I4_CALVF|nr:hypothetical protein CALVIDRAFT_542043 [Calocera viscosa TUFC12733]
MAPSNKLEAKVVRQLKGFAKFAFSKRAIPTLKGTFAYLLVFIFSFLHGYDSLSAYPLALSAPVIMVIALAPGKTVGAVLQNTMLGMMGVLIGAFDFFVLAKVGHVPVAQGVLFAFMIYILALIKAQSIKYLPFSLLAMLMTFNGIFTSMNSGGDFVAYELVSYIKAYAFGAAIVLFVNMFIFPTSSENQLRQMLVSSLDHIRTFTHLVNKGYLMELSDDERVIRGQLVQSLRADFGFLNQLIEQTAIEVVWSRWSMADYRVLVLKMRNLQASLIAAYSGLLNGEENNSVQTFKDHFLPSGLHEFRRMRKDLCLTIGEIMQELATEKLHLSSPDYGQFKEKDVEKQEPAVIAPSVISAEEVEVDHELVLEEVGRRLQQEAADADNASDNTGTVVGGESTTIATSGAVTPSAAVTPHGPTLVDRQLFGEKDADSNPEMEEYGTKAVKNLRNDFDAFSRKQLDLVANLLASGGLSEDLTTDDLNVFQPMTSMADSWGKDHVRGVREAMVKDGTTQAFGIRPIRTKTMGSNKPNMETQSTALDTPRSPVTIKSTDSEEEEEEDQDAVMTGRALVRVYSMLFAMNRLINELQALHTHVTTTAKGVKRRSRLHIHMWEGLKKPDRKKGPNVKDDEDMCLLDAICQLEQREYVPKEVTRIQRLLAIEQWFRSPNSIYAFKVVLALCVFAVLLWAPAVRGWFISYSLTSALPTIVIALTPTLGQSLLVFTLQILGTALGYISGMILLLIFHNVGGYFYNPYGLACLVALYALPLVYIVHEKPALFVLGLLSLNSAGVLIITEYVQTVYLGATGFDSAPYRTGKGLAALAIAITLVFCFQLFILRNPARHTLRKALARLLEENLAYCSMLQAYCRALGPIDPNDRPPQNVVRRVEAELKRREAKLQGTIIGMNPLIAFAAAEPQWEAPFRSEAAVKILRANQILLDRWSEARSAIGSEPFPAFISREFISILSPYRRQANVHTKAALYLAAASMSSKIPLPLEIPKPGKLVSELVHDALVLSSRFAKTEEGRESVKSGEFARYWFFLLVMTSSCVQVEFVEDGCRMIHGSFEDKVH